MKRRAFLSISALSIALGFSVAPQAIAERSQVMTRHANDPDYHHANDGKFRECQRKAYLDGVKLDDCIECHTREGWAVIYSRDASGRLFVSGDDCAKETLWGAVSVTMTA